MKRDRKPLIIKLLITVIVITFSQNAQTQDCKNGGLEYGNLSNWNFTMYQNLNGYIDINSAVPGQVTGQHELVTSGPDAIIPTLSRTYEGNYALRLGDNDISGLNKIAAGNYGFTVSASSPILRFYYAFVLDNPDDHGTMEKPFFAYHVTKGLSHQNGFQNYITGEAIRIDLKAIKMGTLSMTTSGDYAYTDWNYVCIDLSDYIGEDVSIQFYSADCSLNGHGGYAYVDGLCAATPFDALLEGPEEICVGDNLSIFPGIVDHESGGFIIDHSVSLQLIRDDKEIGEPVIIHDGPGLLEEITIHNKFLQKVLPDFVCGDKIKITLTIEDCAGTSTVEKIITVVCPNANAGPDKILCCENFGQTVTLGTPSIPGYSYVWTDKPGNVVGSTAQITIVPPKSQEYTLTVTDQNGCTNTDDVWVVYLSGDMELELEQYGPVLLSNNLTNPPGLCPSDIYLISNLTFPESCEDLTSKLTILSSGVLNQFNYQWSAGVINGGNIGQVPNEPGTYSVTVTEPNCNLLKTASIDVVECPAIEGAIPGIANGFQQSIIAPSAFTPDGDGLNDFFNVSHMGVNVPVNPPTYNATSFRFRVFDRWGIDMTESELLQVFSPLVDYVGYADDCTGFPDQSVPNWDGSSNNGTLFPLGVYPYLLEFWNCSGDYYKIFGSITVIPF